MNDTYISFYLKAYRIHVFVNSLRGIGSPSRICFMISGDGKNLLVKPYPKRDFKSHSVPDKVYKGEGGLDISSFKLCGLIAQMQHWDGNHSYRIPGTVFSEKKIAIFDLTKAEVIDSAR